MIRINIDKLYRYAHKAEPCFIGFPLPKGELQNPEQVCLAEGEERLPLQARAASHYSDGSVKFLFLRFLADIPANHAVTIECGLNVKDDKAVKDFNPAEAVEQEDGLILKTVTERNEAVSIELKHHSRQIFERIEACGKRYEGECFSGPILKEKGQNDSYDLKTGVWEIAEAGPVSVIAKTKGVFTTSDSDKQIRFEIRVTMWAQKPWTEVSFRIINTDDAPLNIQSLKFDIRQNFGTTFSEDAHACVANSNYRMDYLYTENGETVRKVIDADWIMREANEHFSEVFHGTFFADCTDGGDGIAATIYQAHQNYPKALEADRNGIRVMLVPEDAGEVVLQSGMAREQKFLLHFHKAEESADELNDRSIIYQMPYRPYVSPEVQKASGVWPDIFAEKTDVRVEQNLIGRADGHCRAYGMLNFGDTYDSNYTAQGRGGGRLVWSNNEYDYPHACALLYARTGIRRFLDYLIVSASHWMDVDVCHYHRDPLYVGGQWEHTAGHVINGVMVCSHQWVEGLLDYYHFTGDERGLETAIGIGENILRLLDTPAYAKVGESSARETGWALRTLTALYTETNDEVWLEKCGRIVNDFRVWEETYGGWMAPYTDNTLIRTPFMIAVAIGSLMRYYRVYPDEELKRMIVRQVDDLIENSFVKEWGIFYYKELPSLTRRGNNTLLLEALTAAYDLTGDKHYLEYGIETFRNAVSDVPGYSSRKRIEEDAVLVGNVSGKNFAQSLIPLAGYWRALAESGTTF